MPSIWNTRPCQRQATLPANGHQLGGLLRALDTDGNTTDSDQAGVTITN